MTRAERILGRARIWFDVAVVGLAIVAVLWGANAAYEREDTRAAIAARPETVELRREAILAAYMFLASAAPGVEVEVDPHRRNGWDATIYVTLPPQPEPDMVEALETLPTVLPLDECRYRVVVAYAAE